MEPRRRRIRIESPPTAAPFPTSRWQRWKTQWELFHVRDYWWRLLDYFESHRPARLALYCSAALLVSGLVAWHFAYPWWARRNAIRIAQQWLDAGQLRYAAEAAHRAAALAPDRPEPWQIASELARLGGQNDQAMQYARRALELAPEDPVLAITLAAACLNASKPDDARAALAKVAPEVLAESPEAQRILGELARRELRLTEARDYFETAVRLDPGKPINDIPLGTVLLRSTVKPERQRGLGLLRRWTADKQWGPSALRILLEDALQRDDRPGMLEWAEQLRAHPRVTVADMPQWLLALSRADEAHYAAALADLEKRHAGSPDHAAQLLGWLNRIGRHADAIAWLKTLPAAATHRPPLAVLAAEAFRATGAWGDLQAWTDGPSWGPDTDFLRWTYGLMAARALHDDTRADELWRTLFNHAQINTGHAVFAAPTLYSWGLVREAEQLWWRAADQEGRSAIEALGALSRLYQTTRDADGLYRAFRRLHLLQPQDPDIANNFAFYSLLLGRDQRAAQLTAQQNAKYSPTNNDYLATQAFSLVQQQHYADALSLLASRASLAGKSPSIGFAYGLALAGAGRKAEARPLLQGLPPQTLTLAEVELIQRALAD